MFLGSNLAIISQKYESSAIFSSSTKTTQTRPGSLGRLPYTIDVILQDIPNTVQIVSKVNLL